MTTTLRIFNGAGKVCRNEEIKTPTIAEVEADNVFGRWVGGAWFIFWFIFEDDEGPRFVHIPRGGRIEIGGEE